MDKKRLGVFHIDLDGHGLIMLSKYFNKYLGFSSMISVDYGFEEDEENWKFMKMFEEIIIADLSIPQDKVKELRDRGIRVEFYDHHSGADWLAEDEFSVHDLDRSGTKIYWEEYVKPRIPRYKPIIDEFVDLVDTYDLWKQDSPNWERAKNLNNVLIGMKNWDEPDNIKNSERFYDLFVRKIENMASWEETRAELEIIERSNKKEDEVFDKAKKTMQIRIDSKGKIFGLFAISSKISIVCSRILRDEPNLDYVVAFNTWSGLSGRISFRSKEDFNCNDIGIANGHDMAAGAQISVEQSFQFMENPKLAFTYNEDFDIDDPTTYFEEVEI